MKVSGNSSKEYYVLISSFVIIFLHVLIWQIQISFLYNSFGSLWILSFLFSLTIANICRTMYHHDFQALFHLGSLLLNYSMSYIIIYCVLGYTPHTVIFKYIGQYRNSRKGIPCQSFIHYKWLIRMNISSR